MGASFRVWEVGECRHPRRCLSSKISWQVETGWQSGQTQMTMPSYMAGAAECSASKSTKDMVALLKAHQALLLEGVPQRSERQEAGQEKQRVAAAVAGRDGALRALAKRVRDAQQVLEASVEEMAEFKRGRLGSSLDIQELVSYAHRISYTTFAPPEFASGLVPMRGVLPPAPQDEQMRASMLYQANDLDLGLPKSVAPVPSPLVPTEDSVVVEGSATALEPVVPAGWQPGMPIQLPSELPPMPAGWKIGDPIPLPPGLDMLPLPPGWKTGDAAPVSAGLQPQAPAAPAPAPAPGVIHVPFVQLDLNPELEDDFGSDYGSDESNSEEDDD